MASGEPAWDSEALMPMKNEPGSSEPGSFSTSPFQVGACMIKYARLFLAALLLTGCYDVNMVRPDTTIVGQVLRVELTPDGTSRLAPLVGREAARLDGVLLQANDSALTLAVRSLVRRDGTDERWSGEQVRIPAIDVRIAKRESLSRVRTLAVAALGLGAVALAALAVQGGNSSTTTGTGTPPAGR
jgi:hypothetical protein